MVNEIEGLNNCTIWFPGNEQGEACGAKVEKGPRDNQVLVGFSLA